MFLVIAASALACGKSTQDDPAVAGTMAGTLAGTGAGSGGAGGIEASGGGNNSGGDAAANGGKSGEAGAGAGGSQDVCETSRQAAANALARLVLAHQSCEADADCAANSSLGGCYDGTFVVAGCWVPLSASSAETVSAAARELCRPFEDMGCIGLHPCPPVQDLACRSGTCVFVSL